MAQENNITKGAGIKAINELRAREASLPKPEAKKRVRLQPKRTPEQQAILAETGQMDRGQLFGMLTSDSSVERCAALRSPGMPAKELLTQLLLNTKQAKVPELQATLVNPNLPLTHKINLQSAPYGGIKEWIGVMAGENPDLLDQVCASPKVMEVINLRYASGK